MDKLLSGYDDDIKKLILNCTYLMINGKKIPVLEAAKNKHIKPDSYTAAVNLLAETLQDIKRNDPNSFQAIFNLKKENAGLKFCLYVNEWPFGKVAGRYYYSKNELKLNSNMPVKRTYYHELMHAADDGKVVNNTGLNDESVSSNPSVSSLDGKIKNYRQRMIDEWKKDYDELKDLGEKIRRVNILGEKVKSARANFDTRSLHAELKQECRRQMKYFLEIIQK